MVNINDKIKEHEGLITFVLHNYYPSYRYSEDMFQEGRIGLWKAIKTYDETRDIKFSTYASRCVRNQINLAIAKEFAEKRTLDREGFCESLNKPMTGDADFSEEFVHNIEDKNNYQDLFILEDELEKRDERTRQVIALKSHGYNTEEVAKLMHCSGQTIRRIWNDVEKEVRNIIYG